MSEVLWSFDNIEVEWRYHPDYGLDVRFRYVEKDSKTVFVQRNCPVCDNSMDFQIGPDWWDEDEQTCQECGATVVAYIDFREVQR